MTSNSLTEGPERESDHKYIIANPSQTLVFSHPFDEEPAVFSTTLSLKNLSGKRLVFKFKTNNWGAYRVTPSFGVIYDGVTEEVTVLLKKGYHTSPQDRIKAVVFPVPDRYFVPYDSEGQAEMWLNAPKHLMQTYQFSTIQASKKKPKSSKSLETILDLPLQTTRSSRAQKETEEFEDLSSELSDYSKSWWQKHHQAFILALMIILLVLFLALEIHFYYLSLPEDCVLGHSHFFRYKKGVSRWWRRW